MKNLSANVGQGAMVTFINKDGDYVGIPFINLEGEWVPCDVYVKWGASASDPKFRTVFALPANWKPDHRILRAIRKADGKSNTDDAGAGRSVRPQRAR